MKKPREFKLEVTVTVDMEENFKTGKAKLKECTVTMQEHELLALRDQSGLPNVDGLKAVTNALVLGLANNVFYANHTNEIKAADHVAYIQELFEQYLKKREFKLYIKDTE